MATKHTLSKIFLILMIVASFVIIIGPEFYYSSIYIEPFIQYRPFIALAIGLVGVLLFWLKCRKTACLLTLCAVLGGYSTLSSFNMFHPSCDNAAQTTPLRVMSFNIYYKNEQYDQIINEIEKAQADIVFLQEVQSGVYHFGHEKLLKQYPYYYSELEKGIAHGKALYSKYPIVAVKKTLLPRKSHKIVQADIDVNGQLIKLLGTHTLSPRSTHRVNKRNYHIQDLADYIVGKRQNQAPLIVLGDFNTTPWHPVMRQFKSQTELNNNDFYNIIGTWPTWLPSIFTIPIDNIFHSNNFEHINYSKGGLSGSDHYPVYVDLKVCE